MRTRMAIRATSETASHFYRSNIVRTVQIQKQQVVSGFGFRLPVQLFSFIHDSRDRGARHGRPAGRGRGRSERRRGRDTERARTYKSTSTGHSTPRIPSSADLRGTLAGCAPCCTAFTMDLTIGLQRLECGRHYAKLV